MRKTISILLLVLLFQPAGYLFIFKIQQYQVRQEIKQRIKAGLPEEELVLLKIPQALEKEPNSVFLRIHEREFRYRGKMYDIVRQVKHGDTTWYYCVSDEKETELFANLNELVKNEINQNPQRKRQSEKLQQLLNILFVVSLEQLYFGSSGKERELADYLFAIQTWINSPPVPPPQI